MAECGDITRLLIAVRNGDPSAASELMPLVANELQRIARAFMKRERPGHTLEPAALVNEAYLRLASAEPGVWQNRAHFFAIAARIMRQVLLDHGRKNRAVRHGGGQQRVELDSRILTGSPDPVELLAIEELLSRLSERSLLQAQIVEMRWFSGMTCEEVSEVLHISSKTVTRQWKVAQRWFRCELGRHSHDSGTLV